MKHHILKQLLSYSIFFCLVVTLFSEGKSSTPPVEKALIHIDIGHSTKSSGASTPKDYEGKKITELIFWYKYSYYIKRTLEEAGYRCVVTNRGNVPTDIQMREWAKRAEVVQLNHPDNWRQPRYASALSPDRVAGGMVSADYAVNQKAACSIYLHINSTGTKWSKTEPKGLLIYNKNNGLQLAKDISYTIDTQFFAKEGKNQKHQLQMRDVDKLPSAGWMNTCDDAGIPAVVIETFYLNYKEHVQILNQEKKARAYAESIAQGIVRYMSIHHESHQPILRQDKNIPDKGSFGYSAEFRKLKPPPGVKLLYTQKE